MAWTTQNTSVRPTSRTYPEPDTSPNSPSQTISFASIASTANRKPHHTRHQHQDNPARSIWSTWTSMARCHVSLSAVLRTSSVLLTTRLGRCGLTPSEPKIGCSRSSSIGLQWSKIRPVGNLNVSESTMEESLSMKNSSNFFRNVAFDVNIRHPIVRSRTVLQNA